MSTKIDQAKQEAAERLSRAGIDGALKVETRGDGSTEISVGGETGVKGGGTDSVTARKIVPSGHLPMRL
jgi:hypothetical protein